MQTLEIIYTSGGLLLALLSLPLIAGKIKPNPFYGFRTPQTLDDPNIWYASNKYFAKLQLFVSIIITVAALGFYSLPNITVDAYALSVLGVFVAAFITAMILAWKYMKSLK
jgi:hypothetical protein